EGPVRITEKSSSDCQPALAMEPQCSPLREIKKHGSNRPGNRLGSLASDDGDGSSARSRSMDGHAGVFLRCTSHGADLRGPLRSFMGSRTTITDSSTSGPRVPTRRSTRWEQRTRSEPALPVLTHRAPSDSLSRAFPTVSPLRIPHESEPTSDDGRPRCERLSL